MNGNFGTKIDEGVVVGKVNLTDRIPIGNGGNNASVATISQIISKTLEDPFIQGKLDKKDLVLVTPSQNGLMSADDKILLDAQYEYIAKTYFVANASSYNSGKIPYSGSVTISGATYDKASGDFDGMAFQGGDLWQYNTTHEPDGLDVIGLVNANAGARVAAFLNMKEGDIIDFRGYHLDKIELFQGVSVLVKEPERLTLIVTTDGNVLFKVGRWTTDWVKITALNYQRKVWIGATKDAVDTLRENIESIQPQLIKKVNINDLDTLKVDNQKEVSSVCGLYDVEYGTGTVLTTVGYLHEYADDGVGNLHSLHQVFTTNKTLPFGPSHDGNIHTYHRWYNITSTHGEKRTWTEWEEITGKAGVISALGYDPQTNIEEVHIFAEGIQSYLFKTGIHKDETSQSVTLSTSGKGSDSGSEKATIPITYEDSKKYGACLVDGDDYQALWGTVNALQTIVGANIRYISVNELDNLKASSFEQAESMCGTYTVVWWVGNKKCTVGFLRQYFDGASNNCHAIFQELTTSLNKTFSNHDTNIHTYKRWYNITSEHGEIGKWTAWEEITGKDSEILLRMQGKSEKPNNHDDPFISRSFNGDSGDKDANEYLNSLHGSDGSKVPRHFVCLEIYGSNIIVFNRVISYSADEWTQMAFLARVASNGSQIGRGTDICVREHKNGVWTSWKTLSGGSTNSVSKNDIIATLGYEPLSSKTPLMVNSITATNDEGETVIDTPAAVVFDGTNAIISEEDHLKLNAPVVDFPNALSTRQILLPIPDDETLDGNMGFSQGNDGQVLMKRNGIATWGNIQVADLDVTSLFEEGATINITLLELCKANLYMMSRGVPSKVTIIDSPRGPMLAKDNLNFTVDEGGGYKGSVTKSCALLFEDNGMVRCTECFDVSVESTGDLQTL